ncbi:PaaI family thioesterase [Pontivivens insulae]|uniref:Thioesterase domain-containing protein n=1 Tax=Pontivivens insulae TaxID=1639689 RepID=A0A2R8A6B2_9RHOB|nr:PaaI family thioesterase [Pontivivens insulae]RED17846.1 uncharacterized protein (TIGR00369 family) [Pontivivens insulae]SPF27736.1 hypothetical protein POI8812_00029 [Pontivivens insulae]
MPKYAQSLEELAKPEQIAAMSGLEFITAIQRGELPAPPIGETLDYWMEEASEGRVVFRGKPTFKAMNPIGTIHGGWFGTLLDSCMACAVQTTLPAGRGYTTLEYKINIIRPLFANSGEVRAIGEVTHAGRRTGVAEGRIVGVDDGKTYATGSTTCLVYQF